MAIRAALGAGRWRVIRQLLTESAMLSSMGGVLGLLGIVIGVALSLGCSQVMARLLYEVNPTDPMTFACVVCLLLAVTGLACWVPARRAAGVDPMRALRNE
jgi:ABC-type antimicrobial peptide transport system permease subunit